MRLTLLKAKIHRATVTAASLHYQGSISIDRELCKAAGLLQWERVDIYDVDNGERFSTYVIFGETGEICLNGAAARRVQIGDRIIIAAYASFEPEEALQHQPNILLLDRDNHILPELS